MVRSRERYGVRALRSEASSAGREADEEKGRSEFALFPCGHYFFSLARLGCSPERLDTVRGGDALQQRNLSELLGIATTPFPAFSTSSALSTRYGRGIASL